MCLIPDGSHLPCAGQVLVYSHQVDAAYGVLHHIHSSSDEDLEVNIIIKAHPLLDIV